MQSLTISMIQTGLLWEDKTGNLAMLTQKITSIPQGTELVILPEMFSTGFSMQPKKLAEKMDGFTVAWMKEMAAQKKIIIAGSVIIEEENNYYNRLLWVFPNGNCGYYDKRHLFGFANENDHYTAGIKRVIAQVKGWKINLQVCYDLRFPVWARQAMQANAEPEFDLIIYVANWPERRSHAWKTLLAARAIENQCFVAGVNRTGMDGNGIYHSGDSMLVGPLGEILYQKAHDEDIFTVSLQKEVLLDVRNKFPFLKDGDAFDIKI